jgi:diguanylate cyclase (GGDEF)-like protein/PAS domain S-box-containing protein
MFDSLIFSKIAWLGLGGTFILSANYWPGHRLLHEGRKGKNATKLNRGGEEAYYGRFFDLSLELLCIADFHGYFRRVNPAFTEALGYPPEELIAQPYIEFVHPDDRRKTLKQVEKLAQGERLTYFENRYRHADGSYHILAWTAVPYLEENLIYASARDITERQHIETALRYSEATNRALIEAIPDLMFSCSKDGVYLDFKANPGSRLYAPPEAFLGRKIVEVLPQELAQKIMLAFEKAIATQNLQFLEYQLEIGGKLQDYEARILLEEAEKILVIVRNISDRKQIESQLQYSATHDSLTNLPNRILFLERLTQVLQQQQTDPHLNFAVFFLDLDDFKLVNDSLGHPIGDELLKAIAQRLRSCLRPTDTLARIGGDEFALLLARFSTVEEVIQIATDLHQQFQSPFSLNYQDIVIHTSIGIALNITEYNNPEAMLRDADIAMDYAKNQGKGHYAIFDRQMRQQAIERLQMEIELRRAIAKQELILYYQPIVCFKTGRIRGFEALIRWQHPQKGWIPPDQFIPIAEKSGLIVSLGYWVIQEACRQIQKWQDEDPIYADLKININLSYKQLCDPHLLEQILTILNQFNLSPSCLKIEITENTLIESVDLAKAILLDLRQYKIELCLDDFGTGYSSLSYLHQFPFNIVKIDRSFLVKQQSNDEHLEIVKAIITLAHTLGMKVVAEGIETPLQFSQLSWLSCDWGQGDFFARPLPPQEVETLLKQYPKWVEKF